MANVMLNLLRPAAPLVEKTGLQIARDFISQPLFKGVSLWVGGLTAAAHLREIGEFAKSQLGVETAAGVSTNWSQVVGFRSRMAILMGAGVLGTALCLRFRKKLRIVTKPYVFESAVDGSDEVDMNLASSQVHVAIGADHQIEVVGSGVRMDVGSRSFLVTAGHNVSRSAKAIYLVRDGNFYLIPTTSLAGKIDLAADAVAIEIPSSVFSGLRVGKATIGLQPNEAYVSVTGLSGRGTNGKLQLIRGQFGRLQYFGSTSGGYSGAPYWSGKSVYGIHTNGGHANEGFSIAYLYQMLKLELGVYDEGDYNYSWFKKFVKKRGEKQIREVGDFVVMINDDGYCYSVPKSKHAEYETMLQRENAINAGREQYQDDYEESDSDAYVPESKNWKRPGISPGGRRSRSVPPSVGDRQLQLQTLESLARLNAFLESRPNHSDSVVGLHARMSRLKREVKRSHRPSSPTQ